MGVHFPEGKLLGVKLWGWGGGGAAQFSEGQISGGSFTGGDSPGSKLPGGNFIGVILLGEFSRMGFSLYSEYNTMRLTLLQA